MGFTQYSGSASNYPSKDTWKPWPDIFYIFQQSMVDAGSTWDDVNRIFVAINEAAKMGVEERVILCIIIKASSGNVGVGTPDDNGHNPTGGLMQSEESKGFPGQKNLSQADITGMVKAGTEHFKGNLEQQGNGDDAKTIYEALRLYNTGRVDPNNLNDDWTGNGHSDPNYVSVVANYLQGILG